MAGMRRDLIIASMITAVVIALVFSFTKVGEEKERAAALQSEIANKAVRDAANNEYDKRWISRLDEEVDALEKEIRLLTAPGEIAVATERLRDARSEKRRFEDAIRTRRER